MPGIRPHGQVCHCFYGRYWEESEWLVIRERVVDLPIRIQLQDSCIGIEFAVVV